MRRLVAIHVLPAMRLVLPAFVCSVGNRVVAMAVSLLGSRCSFIASCPLVARRCCRMPWLHRRPAIFTLTQPNSIPSATAWACVGVFAGSDDVPWRSFSDVLDSQQFHVCPHQSRHRATLSRWRCRSLPPLMTCAHTQELQRTLPGARRISFADESGAKLWARYQ